MPAAAPPAPAIYQLLGFPGTGKYTIARQIVTQLGARGRTAKLLDNHATANLIFDLAPVEDRFSATSTGHIHTIRGAVLQAIEDLSPPDWSFVFTNFIPPTATMTTPDRHRDLAQRRRVPFVGVQLACDREELLRRVVGDDRAGRLKLVDPVRTEEVLAEGTVLPTWPDLATLDVTHLSPADAAAAVIALTPHLPAG